MTRINIPLCVILISFILIVPNVSKTGRKLPKDQLIIGKHGAKFKEVYSATIANRSKVGESVPIRSENSPVVLYMWTPNVSDHGTWEEWKFCSEYGFIKDMKITYNFDRESDDEDSPGIHQVDMNCINFYNVRKKESLTTGGRFPEGFSSSELLECPGVIHRMWVRQLADMNCQDDLGIVNLKGGCAGQEKKEVFGSGDPYFVKGEWSPALTCPSGSALCGVKSQVSLKSTVLNYPDFRNCEAAVDAYGITNMAFACCLLEDPSFRCIPQVTWKTRTNITGSTNNMCSPEDDKGSPICKFITKLGLEYSPDAPQVVVDVYENTGFPIQGVKRALIKNFESSLRPLDSYSFRELFRKAPQLSSVSSVVYANDCDGAVQDLILECKMEDADIGRIPMYSFYTGKFRCVSHH